MFHLGKLDIQLMKNATRRPGDRFSENPFIQEGKRVGYLDPMRISEDEHTEIMGPEIAKMSGGARQAETCSGHLQRKQFLEFKDI